MARKTSDTTKGMLILLILLISLIVGMSRFYFEYAENNWVRDALSDDYSLFRNICFLIACICMMKYYEKLSFRRGILTAIAILLGTFAFSVFGYVFASGILPIICLVLNSFASVFCGLLVTSAIAYRYFRKHCFLVIGCGSALIQISNTLFSKIFNTNGFESFTYFAIWVCAGVFLLSLIFLPDIALGCGEKDGHKDLVASKSVAFIALGMLILGVTAGNLLDLGNETSASAGMNLFLFFNAQDLAASAGCILFGYLADRFRLHRIFLIYCIICICTVVNVYFAGPAILTFICKGFGFAMLAMVSPAAAVSRSGDHYYLLPAAGVQAAYHVGVLGSIIFLAY